MRNGDEREFINTYINRAINKTRERLWMGSDVSVKKQGVPDLAVLQRATPTPNSSLEQKWKELNPHSQDDLTSKLDRHKGEIISQFPGQCKCENPL